MKSNSVNYLVVGVFVLAMLAATVTAIALLSGKTGPTVKFYSEYEEVAGVKFGTKVLFMGYPVGQVEEIEPVWDDQGQLVFKLELAISNKWQDRIPQDSVAELRGGQLLSPVVIDIEAGNSDKPLSPGDTMGGRENGGLFGDLLGSMGEGGFAIPGLDGVIDNVDKVVADARDFMEKANVFADKTNALMDSQLAPMLTNARSNLDSFGDTLDDDGGAAVKQARATVEDVHAAVNELRSAVQSWSADIDRQLPQFTQNSVDASAQLKSILGPENAATVERTLANAEATTGRTRTAADNVGAKLETAADNVVAITTDEKIEQTLVNVRDASAALDDLLTQEKIEKVDDILDNVRGASRNLEEMLAAETVTKVRTSLDDISAAARNVAALSRDLRETRGKLDHFIETLDKVAVENRPDIRETVKDLRQAMDTVNHHIGTIAHNLEGTSRNMREFSRQLRQNPGALLGGKPPTDSAQY